MKVEKAIETLFEKQLQNWEMARENYAGLQHVSLKLLQFNGYQVLAQYNPKRIISSSAKVDAQSINERPCFLCAQKRPIQQEGVPFANDYLILINPYPVFHHHLTIPSIEHLPQRISGRFDIMLRLARDLQDYTIVYNGPGCGASAPDHFHFQGIPLNILPLESDWAGINVARTRIILQECTVDNWHNYLRSPITLSGNDAVALQRLFGNLYKLLSDALPAVDEPMMNILAQFRQDKWIVHIFPRILHRPRQYFEQGNGQLLLSPASIDMGGVLVFPRQEDYNKITREDVADVYHQVCVDEFFVRDILTALNHTYEQQKIS
jgi:hypothetical protein